MDDIAQFFEDLDLMNPKSGHIAVMPCVRRPWIRKYVWLAAAAPPAVPTATPSNGHSFWVAVRNLSVGTYRVSFECESQNGRLRFDKSSPPGYKFSVDLAAPAATRDGFTHPNFTTTAIALDGNSEPVEVVSIRAKAFRAGEQIEEQVGDEETGTLTFRLAR